MVANSDSDRSTPLSHTDEAAEDEILSVLSRMRRRIVLDILDDHRTMAMADLAESVACQEDEAPFAELSEQQILEVYSSLWHRDIPKLDEVGLVTYDQESDLVHITRLGEDVDVRLF